MDILGIHFDGYALIALMVAVFVIFLLRPDDFLDVDDWGPASNETVIGGNSDKSAGTEKKPD